VIVDFARLKSIRSETMAEIDKSAGRMLASVTG